MDKIKSMFQAGSINGFWSKLPTWMRAIVIGLIVNTIGVGFWILGIHAVPSPWFLVVMALFLVAYIKFFSGGWLTGLSASTRKRRFREVRLSKSTWLLGITGALLFVLVCQSSFVITFRLIEFPAQQFKAAYNLDAIPPHLAWLSLIMASFVAGICEEIGFRGYMQQPMEKKYGPLTAISVTSIVFVVVHLHQAWAGPVLIHIFAVSALFGILAYKTRSLIPGIIAHTVLDIINFSYWWSDLAGKFERETISITGVDLHFVAWGLLFLGGLVAFYFTIKKLNPLRA